MDKNVTMECLWKMNDFIIHDCITIILLSLWFLLYATQLQHTLLDIHTLLNYIETLYLLLAISSPAKPLPINQTWMGCFTKNTEICDSLYYTGVTVWLICNEAIIPSTMNIVCLMRLTFPEHIIRAMYSENGVAKPFWAIYHGPASPFYHYYTCWYFKGLFTKQPEPLAMGSSIVHVSSQQCSHGEKQVTDKWSKDARKATAGPSKGLWFFYIVFCASWATWNTSITR